MRPCSMVELHILWHFNPLLGNDRETSNLKTTVTKQRPLNGDFFYAENVDVL
jgi:hypothetical protein